MIIRNTITVLAGALALAGFQPTSQAFFMPPAAVAATELVTWPADIKTMGADVSRLHDIEFDECLTDDPVLLMFGAFPGSEPSPLRLRSDACEGDSKIESLPDGVSEIRIEVTCQDGGGGYELYAAYDGTQTDPDGALAPSASNEDAYGDCLEATESPGFRVVFEF